MRAAGQDRAAIYARMSSLKQSPDSPADQIAHCRLFASRQGLEVVESLVVDEPAISAESRHNRPGLLSLIERMDEWDVLLCWEFSRVSRDGEDLGWIRNRLRLHRKTAFEVSTGLDIFNVGARVIGVLNEEYLEKLRADTHRGLRGRVERKLWAGGLPFGYRTEPVPSGRLDSHGQAIPEGYRLLVDPEKAGIVRRLFYGYLQGQSLRELSHALNAEGVLSPRGKGWAVSSVRALLLNPIYKGRYEWNKSEWRKDHATGRRKKFVRPQNEWLVDEDPAWAIVEPETWDRVKAKFDERANRYPRVQTGQFAGSSRGNRVRSRYLLSGFLSCGMCGGGFFAINGRSGYGCSWHRDRGPAVCANDRILSRQVLEGAFLNDVQNRILTPENVGYVLGRVMMHASEFEGRKGRRDAARVELSSIEVELSRLVRLAAETGELAEIAAEVKRLKTRREALTSSVLISRKSLDLTVIRAAAERRLADLRSWFNASGEMGRRALRQLLGDRRLLVHSEGDGSFRLEGVFELGLEARDARAPHSDAGRLASVVAGTRFDRSETRCQPFRLALPVRILRRAA